MERADGVLIFDETIVENSFSKKNALNTWDFDHTKNRMVKEINLLNAHYHAGEASISVVYQLMEKPNELSHPVGRGINIEAIFFASANARETPEAAGNMPLRDSTSVTDSSAK